MLPYLLHAAKKYLSVTFFIFALSISQTGGQVLKDPSTLELVRKAVDQMYSMSFSEALKTCDQINGKYKDHPVVSLLRGMLIYWKNYPLMSGSVSSRAFEEQMHQCIEKCEDYKDDNEAELLLANLCARGVLLLYYAANNLTSKAFSLGTSSYRYLRRSFAYTGTFPDFYFFTGLYNYYREAYPDAHPSYKPLFAILPKGDRAKGMHELETAFTESIFMKAEASTFLSSNNKYFENDFEKAAYFSKTIYNKYPSNTVYLINCIEDLLLTRRYDEAEKLILSPASRTNNRYYQAQLIVLRGVLNEKKYRNTAQARQQYSIGAESLAEYGEYGNQFAAYAYFGLSRLSADNTHDQKIYRRKAVDLADFAEVNFDN
jgi:hypothetical protein